MYTAKITKIEKRPELDNENVYVTVEFHDDAAPDAKPFVKDIFAFELTPERVKRAVADEIARLELRKAIAIQSNDTLVSLQQAFAIGDAVTPAPIDPKEKAVQDAQMALNQAVSEVHTKRLIEELSTDFKVASAVAALEQAKADLSK